MVLAALYLEVTQLSIRIKLTLIATVPALLICLTGWYWVRENLYDQVERSVLIRANSVVNKMNQVFDEHESYWRGFFKDEAIQQVLHESNVKYEAIQDVQSKIDAADYAWRNASAQSPTPLATSILESDTSKELIKQLKILEEAHGYLVYGEVFFTNQYGVNVAQTGYTSDYRQDDEDWWIKARRQGTYLDGVKYDESSGIYSTALCIRIDDTEGQFVGVGKVIMNIREMTEIIDWFSVDQDNSQSTHIVLLRDNYNIIHESRHEGYEPFRDGWHYLPSGKIVGPVEVAATRFDENYQQLMYSVVLAPEDNSALGQLGWVVVYEQPVNYVFASVQALRNSMLGFKSVVFLILGLISVVGCMKISGRIRHMVDITKRLGKGDLDVRVEEHHSDELGELAKSFNLAIEALKQSKNEQEKLSQQLVNASRKAGMAEVATGVLHNVGNVLNSLSVSSQAMGKQVSSMRVDYVTRAADLILEHRDHLTEFVNEDDAGKRVPEFLHELGSQLKLSQHELDQELRQLRIGVEHITKIINSQQEFATDAVNVDQQVNVNELVENALALQEASRCKHEINVETQLGEVPTVTTDQHLVMQVLINMISNAKYALNQASHSDKMIQLRTFIEDDHVCVSVKDNGVGISAEQIEKIFQYGYTTKENGHGFGLHSAANAVNTLGGELSVHSDGVGQGAEFILRIPVHITIEVQ